MKRSIKTLVLTVALTLVASSMFAQSISTTNNNNVTANVTGGCRWVTPLTMPFGAYDPFAVVALTQTATVEFQCIKRTNPGNVYRIWFSKTAGNMTDGTDNLAYTLTDSLGAALPTNAAGAVAVGGVAGIGAGSGYTFQVDGSVAAGQDVGVGNYADTVVVHVEY